MPPAGFVWFAAPARPDAPEDANAPPWPDEPAPAVGVVCVLLPEAPGGGVVPVLLPEAPGAGEAAASGA